VRRWRHIRAVYGELDPASQLSDGEALYPRRQPVPREQAREAETFGGNCTPRGVSPGSGFDYNSCERVQRHEDVKTHAPAPPIYTFLAALMVFTAFVVREEKR